MYSLLIADDEPIECVALEHKIKELIPEIALISSVHDGISLLKKVTEQKPDIVIVDINMPGLSGLEAIELLKIKEINLKIIINTCYSDFAYIQKALQLGASDYLLKPGKKQALEKALRKVCMEIDKERAARRENNDNQELVNGLKKVAAEKWILSLQQGKMDQECFQLLAKEMPEINEGGYFTAWKIGDKKEKDTDYKKLIRTIREESRDLCKLLGVLYRDIYYVFFMKKEKKEIEEGQEEIQEILSYLFQKVKDTGMTVSVACSRYKKNADDYITGIREAEASLNQIHRNGIYYFHYGCDEKTEYIFKDREEDIMYNFKKGDIERVTVKIKEICNRQMETSGAEIEEIKAQIAILFTQIFAKCSLTVSEDFWSDFRMKNQMQDLIKWVELSLKKIISQSGKEENPYIQKAMIYMRENYQEDISLNDIAEKLGISSFYLSRMFKQEKECSFVEVLTDMRIREAIRLLHTTHLSNQEICQRVGYASTAYFYRVFKKTTGFTVGTIRQIR